MSFYSYDDAGNASSLQSSQFSYQMSLVRSQPSFYDSQNSLTLYGADFGSDGNVSVLFYTDSG